VIGLEVCGMPERTQLRGAECTYGYVTVFTPNSMGAGENGPRRRGNHARMHERYTEQFTALPVCGVYLNLRQSAGIMHQRSR